MIRKLVLKVLSGENALKMDVASFPVDEEALKTQLAASKALGEALSGKGALNVTVKNDGPATSPLVGSGAFALSGCLIPAAALIEAAINCEPPIKLRPEPHTQDDQDEQHNRDDDQAPLLRRTFCDFLHCQYLRSRPRGLNGLQIVVHGTRVLALPWLLPC
jgi:hypothetical protein